MRGQAHRIGRLFVAGAGISLGALHVVVLLRRVSDGTLLEPVVLAQWLVAIALLAAGAWLRRRGVSLFRGRAAAAFWIAVVLMHGMVALPGAPGLVGVLNTLPATDAMPVGAGLLVGALAVLAGFSKRRFTAPPKRSRAGVAAAALGPIWRPQAGLAARAPPRFA